MRLKRLPTMSFSVVGSRASSSQNIFVARGFTPSKKLALLIFFVHNIIRRRYVYSCVLPMIHVREKYKEDLELRAWGVSDG